jgi:hypothetical protein
MQSEAQAKLAEVQAVLLQDRQTFERQVSAVFDRLAADRLQLAEEHRRLLARRNHLVLVGKRLRSRWLKQKRVAERELKEQEKLLLAWTRQLEIESAQVDKQKARLKTQLELLSARLATAAAERRTLSDEKHALEWQRAELLSLRMAAEAERQSSDERQSQLEFEMIELQQQIEELQRTRLSLVAVANTPNHDIPPPKAA